jgi:hypothetical protein
VLQSTKAFWEKHGHNFTQDMRVLANTTDKHFRDFQINMQQAALQNTSIAGLIGQAGAQGATAVQKTLQHVLMHTANAAMTEGSKTVVRHMGQAMNERFGSFAAFFTTNFADTYHVLTQVLAHGAGEPLGWRPLNILQDSPPMPTPQVMHKIFASRPMVQAKLFLHLEASAHQNLLCARRSFVGKQKYDPCFKWQDEPVVEDDFASSGDFGVAALLRALLKALEAQGRGFAHGHEKLHSEPITKAIDIIQLFLGCRRCCRARAQRWCCRAHNGRDIDDIDGWMHTERPAFETRRQSSMIALLSPRTNSDVRRCKRYSLPKKRSDAN